MLVCNRLADPALQGSASSPLASRMGRETWESPVSIVTRLSEQLQRSTPILGFPFCLAFLIESQNVMGLEWTLQSIQSQHPATDRTPLTWPGSSKPYLTWLWPLPGLGHLQPPWATCPSSVPCSFLSYISIYAELSNCNHLQAFGRDVGCSELAEPSTAWCWLRMRNPPRPACPAESL